MAEEGGYSPMENIVHRNSDEEIKQLMTRFSVSEEDVQVDARGLCAHSTNSHPTCDQTKNRPELM